MGEKMIDEKYKYKKRRKVLLLMMRLKSIMNFRI